METFDTRKPAPIDLERASGPDRADREGPPPKTVLLLERGELGNKAGPEVRLLASPRS